MRHRQLPKAAVQDGAASPATPIPSNHGLGRVIAVPARCLVSGLAILVLACGDGATEPSAPPPDPPRPTTVTVTPATAELTALGETVQLRAEVRDQNDQSMAGASVTWASSSAAVATVSAAGLVTGLAAGEAEVTATSSGVSGGAMISVWISTLSEWSVRVLYVVPADKEFRNDYSDGLSRAIVDVQGWYRRQLDGLTFDIYSVIPEPCHLPGNEEYYSRVDPWQKVLDDVQSCAPVVAGVSVTDLVPRDGPLPGSSRFTWLLYIDVVEACDGREGQGFGAGWDGVAMMASGDLEGLSNPGPYSACDGGPWQGTLGRWRGGTAHELGHTLLLPHPPGCEETLPTCDRGALMWDGYGDYPDTYLRDDEKAILRRSPFIKR